MKRVEIFLETLNDADFLEIKGGVIDGKVYVILPNGQLIPIEEY